MTRSDKIGISLLCAVFVGIGFLVINELRGQVKFWSEYALYHKERHEYYFKGANERHLLDLCEIDGKAKIVFKEECKP